LKGVRHSSIIVWSNILIPFHRRSPHQQRYEDLLILIPRTLKILPQLLSENGGTASSEVEPGPRKWRFVEKWILREAVKPFITEEIYLRKKSQYNAPISRPTPPTPSINGVLGDSSLPELTPLQRLLKGRLTPETVGRLGWANWDYVRGLLDGYLEAPETPDDGGLDKRARCMLLMLSFVVLQERFGVPRYESGMEYERCK
jgi:asparagine synthase (glutamine-hydrolysing)